MKINSRLLAVQLLGQWNRISQVHLSLNYGCSCNGSLPGLAVNDLEINIIDFLNEKYSHEAGFVKWLRKYAQYIEGTTGSVSELLKNIALEPPPPNITMRVLKDLSNTIESLNKTH